MTYKRNNKEYCDICYHDITRFEGVCPLHGTHEQQEVYIKSLKKSKIPDFIKL